MKRFFITTVTLLSVWFSTQQAYATEPLIALDAEVDPLAYVLNGHSVHLGLWLGQVRVDLGAFGLDMPEWLHQQEGFSSRFGGFGTKVDYIFRSDRMGGFVGIEGSLNHITISQQRTGQTRQLRVGQVGVRAGWRFELGYGVFVAPWIGVGRQLGPQRIHVGDGTFTQSAWTIFPTIHIGWLPTFLKKSE